MKKERFVIIDGNALIHRAFHALPPLSTKAGEMVNAVYGFTSVLLKVMKDLKPDYIAATFDLAAPTFRHEAFKEYKATRVKAPQDLYDQIPRVKEIVQAFNIPIFEQEGFEADDCIGTIVQKLQGKPIETFIVTGDLDTLQLVNDQTKVYTLKKGVGETTVFGRNEVVEKFGLSPEQIVDYKALRGDPSDNIPGVPGVGEKTAVELLKKFQTLDALYDALKKKRRVIQEIKPRVLELLQKHEREARLSRKLATIVQSVPITFVLNDTIARSYDRQQVIGLFQQLEFKSLLGKLPTLTLFREAVSPTTMQKKPKPHESVEYHLVDTLKKWKKLKRLLNNVKKIAVDTETTSLDALEAELLGVSISWKPGQAYFVSVRGSEGKILHKELVSVLKDRRWEKIGHNSKYDFKVLHNSGVTLDPIVFDTMLASYLINPGSRQHDLDSLTFREFGYEMMPITDLIGPKGKYQLPMEKVPVEKLSWYGCEDADYTWRLSEKLGPELEEKQSASVFHKIEVPLVPVLGEMELAGVKIDRSFLATKAKTMKREIHRLKEKIFQAAGTSFNINSPLQLKEVLFGKLNISSKGIGKTKTGLSTAASELEKLRTEHPFVETLLAYRELTKLTSTYLEALPKLIKKTTGRVHTEFNQAVTATGRLSSSNPNLQNIPVRTELGRQIRQAFIAEPGFVLLSADYSQIELRVAAALAMDEGMMKAFQKGEDIHRRTAAEIQGVPIEKVTKQMRYAAKEVNFGVIYGMGAYGLASRTGISREEARSFIDRYFTLHHGIHEFLETTKALARSRGFVETLFGRRRYIPEINSQVMQIRNAAERMAINMPIQGTAADLMKLAMIAIHRDLPNVSSRSRMVMQVHDELVFEVPKAEVRQVASFVRESMETVEKLKVPIDVDLSAGKNWGELSPLEI